MGEVANVATDVVTWVPKQLANALLPKATGAPKVTAPPTAVDLTDVRIRERRAAELLNIEMRKGRAQSFTARPADTGDLLGQPGTGGSRVTGG